MECLNRPVLEDWKLWCGGGKRRRFLLPFSFSCVCPEPVLAKLYLFNLLFKFNKWETVNQRALFGAGT